MPKRSRLKFLGIQLTLNDVRLMRDALGYNTDPKYEYGWGNYHNRNFLGFGEGSDHAALCRGMVEKGIMSVQPAPKFCSEELVFRLTDLGKRWFGLYKRHHKHPNLWRQ